MLVYIYEHQLTRRIHVWLFPSLLVAPRPAHPAANLSALLSDETRTIWVLTHDWKLAVSSIYYGFYYYGCGGDPLVYWVRARTVGSNPGRRMLLFRNNQTKIIT